MARWSRLVLVLVGVAAGTAGTLLLTGGGGSRADAQPAAAAKPGEVGRYQISSWGTGLSGMGGPIQVVNGAYIVDTQTGDVFSVANEGRPKRVGTVGEKH